MRLLITPLAFIGLSVCAAQIEDDHYGSIKLGMAEHEAVALLSDYISDHVVYDNPYACHYLSPVDGSPGVHYMVVEDKIVRFDVYDAELHLKTQKGLGIGSIKSQVLAAYPSAISYPHPYIAPDGEYIEVTLENGNGIIFETEFNVVTSYRLGRFPAITFIEGCL